LVRDQTIIALKRYIVGLEARVCGPQTPTAEAGSDDAEDVVVVSPDLDEADLRPSIVLAGEDEADASAVIRSTLAAAEFVDLAVSRARPVDYTVVSRLEAGRYFVHPRSDTVSAAWLGPFAGPMPDLVTLSVAATRENGPRIDFHASVLPASDSLLTAVDRLQGLDGRNAWLAASPADGECRLSVWPRVAASANRTWGLLLATRASNGGSIDFGAAVFSEAVAFWSSPTGAIARRFV